MTRTVHHSSYLTPATISPAVPLAAATLYALAVLRTLLIKRSPAGGLLVGLVVTVCAVVAYSWYVRLQIVHLRQVQRELVDRNRLDSLQLLRIQNDLNGLALGMRDMLEGDEPYPLTAWKAQFFRLRTDLDDALRLEDKLAVAHRTPEQRQYLANSVAQFWGGVDEMFKVAEAGKEKEAAAMVRVSLQTQQAGLSTAVARLLVENNLSEEQAAKQIEQVYSRVESHMYLFLGAALVAILGTSLLVMRSNRLLFSQLALLSEQRSELAQKLIATQESTLQAISRELHDEFGQVLTAIGSTLGRASKKLPADSPWIRDLGEARQITQSALDNVRTLSQALHPVTLDEAGLESALDWYLSTVQRQNGLAIHYEKTGASQPISTRAGIHIYRILQEALNNVVRHSGAKEVYVRLRFLSDRLLLEVEDHGLGMQSNSGKRGIGLVAMRERAELLGGNIGWLMPADGGTIVRLEVPQEQLNE